MIAGHIICNRSRDRAAICIGAHFKRVKHLPGTVITRRCHILRIDRRRRLGRDRYLAQVCLADGLRLIRARTAGIVSRDQFDRHRLQRAGLHTIEILRAQTGEHQRLVLCVDREHVVHSDRRILRTDMVSALIVASHLQRDHAAIRVRPHRIAEQCRTGAEPSLLQSLLLNRLQCHRHGCFGPYANATCGQRGRRAATALSGLAGIVCRADGHLQRFKAHGLVRVEIVCAGGSQQHLAIVQRKVSSMRPVLPCGSVIAHRKADRAAVGISAHRIGKKCLACTEIPLGEARIRKRSKRHDGGRLRADGHVV